MKRCRKCGTPIEMERVSVRDECPKCGSDLHICLNCKFYDENKAYGCMEMRAEPPREKERANFCDYFQFREEEEKRGREQAEKIWEEIFGKKK